MSIRVNAVHFYPDYIIVSWFTEDRSDYVSKRIKRGGKAEQNVIKLINKTPFSVNIGINKVAIFLNHYTKDTRLTNFNLDRLLEG